jgi:Icc-related predicted phosphoesterase
VNAILYSPDILPRFENVDLVLSCGDLPFPYLEYVLTVLNVPMLYVPGNHDRAMHTFDGRTIEAPEGAINIDARLITLRLPHVRPLTIAGFGGSMYYGGTSNQYTDWQMRRRIASIEPRLLWTRITTRRGIDVLVTHAPPYGIHDGLDRCHQGFRSFLSFLRRYRPSHHFHGHVHPAYGYDVAPKMYHGTQIRNVYGYEVLEISI